jgi:hypothetical protein
MPVNINGKTVYVPIRHVDLSADFNKKFDLGGVTNSVPEMIIVKNSKRVSSVSLDKVWASGLGRAAKKSPSAAQLADAKLKLSDFEDAITEALIPPSPKKRDELADVSLKGAFRTKHFFPAAVALVGTGMEESPLFVPESLKRVKRVLNEEYNFPSDAMITLYGEGSDSKPVTKKEQLVYVGLEPYASQTMYGRATIPSTGLGSEEKPNLRSVQQFFRSLRDQKTEKALLVLSGHGSREGIQLWGEDKKFSPEDLGDLTRSVPKTEVVVVSGTCYGGAFASKPVCGFFAARPDRQASGCGEGQLSLGLPDYTKIFFEAFQPDNLEAADLDGDKKVTFEEAHWYAFQRVYDSDVPFTAIDYQAEESFKADPNAYPNAVSIDKLRQLSQKYGTKGEAAALSKYISNTMPPTAELQIRKESFDFSQSGLSGTIRLDPWETQGGSSENPELSLKSSSYDRLSQVSDSLYSVLPPDTSKTLAIRIKPAADSAKNTLEVLGTLLDKSKAQYGWINTVDFDTSKTYPTGLQITVPKDKLKISNIANRLRVPKLAQIARRLLYKEHLDIGKKAGGNERARLEQIEKCERQTLSEFLATGGLNPMSSSKNTSSDENSPAVTRDTSKASSPENSNPANSSTPPTSVEAK